MLTTTVHRSHNSAIRANGFGVLVLLLLILMLLLLLLQLLLLHLLQQDLGVPVGGGDVVLS